MYARKIIVFLLALSGFCWQVEPDPSQAPLQLSASKKAIVPAHPTAVFSTRPSPFVFTVHGSGEKSMVSLWHLSMGRIAGPTEAENANWSLMRLSPDGQALVGWSTLRGKYRSTVWDAKTGKRIWRGTRDYGVQPWRDFASLDSIVAVDNDLRVWNFRDNTLTHEIDLPRGAGRGGVISPGGRYVVLAGYDQKLRFVDLRSSQLADELAIPSFPGITKSRVQAMAFSADGSELAILLRTSQGSDRATDTAAIVSWSMKTGALQQQHRIERADIAKLTTSGHVPAIASLPHFNCWLVWNSGIIERKSGRLLALLPPPPHTRRFAAPTWPLADGRILGYLTGGYAHNPMFAVYDVAKTLRARVGKLGDVSGDLPKTELAGTDWGHAHARLSELKVMPAEQKKALPEDILQTILNDLRSSDLRRAEAALESLARAQPQAKQQADVLPALREVSSKRQTGFIAIAGFWTMAQWQTLPVAAASAPAPGRRSDELAAFTADLQGKEFARVVAAFRGLQGLDSEAAALAVGTHYAVNRGLARQALTKMTHKRKALLAMLKNTEWTVRVDAIRLLATHGTPDDIPALEALRNDPQRIVQMQVPKVIQQIQSREKP
jgi:hypothetical protein